MRFSFQIRSPKILRVEKDADPNNEFMVNLELDFQSLLRRRRNTTAYVIANEAVNKAAILVRTEHEGAVGKHLNMFATMAELTTQQSDSVMKDLSYRWLTTGMRFELMGCDIVLAEVNFGHPKIQGLTRH